MNNIITEIEEKKLTELIKAFYNLTGIKVAVYDSQFCEIISYPENDSPFCTMIHQNKLSCRKCSESMELLCSKCSVKQTVTIEKCHAGLTEVIAPLSDGICNLGYIMFGQIRSEKDIEQFRQNVIEKCVSYQIDKNVLTEFTEDIRYYSVNQLEDASKILNALASYIVSDKMVYQGVKSDAHRIAEYIMNNPDKDLSVAALCREFYVSKSELYKLTAHIMPDGVANYIKNVRLEKAASLIRHTNMSVWEICEKTGFSDVNYFMRIFKKKYGVSVSEYRK